MITYTVSPVHSLHTCSDVANDGGCCMHTHPGGFPEWKPCSGHAATFGCCSAPTQPWCCLAIAQRLPPCMHARIGAQCSTCAPCDAPTSPRGGASVLKCMRAEGVPPTKPCRCRIDAARLIIPPKLAAGTDAATKDDMRCANPSVPGSMQAFCSAVSRGGRPWPQAAIVGPTFSVPASGSLDPCYGYRVSAEACQRWYPTYPKGCTPG